MMSILSKYLYLSILYYFEIYKELLKVDKCSAKAQLYSNVQMYLCACSDNLALV